MKHKEPAKKPKKVIGFSTNLFAKYKFKSIWKAVKTPKNIPGIIRTIQKKSKTTQKQSKTTPKPSKTTPPMRGPPHSAVFEGFGVVF